MLCTFCTNMAATFALAVVQDTLERLDSYQDGDYSGILLRLEYLNRITRSNRSLEECVRYVFLAYR